MAGGGGVVVSTFLPWFSWLGLVQASVPFGLFLVLAAAGALVGYLGVRALKGRATQPVMTTLWVVSVLAALFTAGVVEGTLRAGTESAGSVTPSAGLYLVVLSLMVTVLGTVLLQVTRRAGGRR